MTGAFAEPVVRALAGEIPVIWQPCPGPVIAALGFRVGRADEPLARSGLTHLVEHLAGAGLGERLYDYDGFVNGTMTWFGFRGTPEELVAHFGHVGRNLARLPLDRLQAELGVLRAEQGRRALTTAGRCLLLRHGAQGWGTYDLPEYGLNAVTADQVAEWASGWFGAGNAVLWMTGEPPAGLSVELPPGPARPEPPAAPLPGRRLPGWATHERRVTAVSFVLPRSAESVVAAAILRGRLRHVLRDVDGSGYDVSLAVDHLDGRSTHVLLTADGPSTSVVEVLQAVTGALASDGPTEEELAHQRALSARRLADPSLTPGRLAALAGAQLCGWSAEAPAAELLQLERVCPAAMAALFGRALATALYLVPVGTPFPASLAAPLAAMACEPVSGKAHRPAAGRRSDRLRLVAGPEGISEVDGDRSVTVRTGEVAAVLSWRSGARLLIGKDGTALAVDPARWVNATRALAAFESAVPEAVLVPMGEGPSWPTAPAGSGRRWWRRRRRVGG